MKISTKNNKVFAVFTGGAVPDDATMLILSALSHQTAHWCQILERHSDNNQPFLAAWDATNKPSDEYYAMHGFKHGEGIFRITFRISKCVAENIFSVEFNMSDKEFFYMDEDASLFGFNFTSTAHDIAYGKSAVKIANEIAHKSPISHLLAIPVPSEERDLDKGADDIRIITSISTLVNNASRRMVSIRESNANDVNDEHVKPNSDEVTLPDVTSLVQTINDLKEKTDGVCVRIYWYY